MIKKDFGGTFRKLREGKNLSISSISDDNISKSMISKFERNQSDISVSRFFHLLNKINVRPPEFEITLNEFYADGFQMLLSDVTAYSMEGNTRKLKALSDRELGIYYENKNTINKLNHLMIEVMISMVENKELPADKDFSYITNYLFNCEYWSYYELVLYGNTMGKMDIEKVLIFSKHIPSKTLLMKDAGNLYAICINLIMNTISIFIENGYQNESRYFLVVLDQLDIEETMIFEKVLHKYYEGLHRIKFEENSSSGKEMLNESLSIFKILDCQNLYDIFYSNYVEMLND